MAIANLIVYRTKNRNQAIRIFRASELGKRPKANRSDYVNGLIQKALDQTLPPINFELYNKEIEEKLSNNRPVAQLVEPIPHKNLGTGSNPVGPTIQKPPGKLGELAQFFYDSAPSPVHEIAVAGAIVYAAQFCGRAYNVSDEGLSHYVICLAPSGMGKENVRRVVNLLNIYVGESCPIVHLYRGADDISSGQALIKDIISKPCQLSIMGEFVYKLQVICSPRANSSEIRLKQALLELIVQSGKHGHSGRTIYANTNENKEGVQSPNFTLFCEGIPKVFNKIIDNHMFYDGFLPRFLIIKYEGLKPYFNENRKKIPDYSLISHIAELVSFVEIQTNPRDGTKRKIIDIQATPEVHKLLKELSRFQTDKENDTDDEREKAILSRLYMNVYKLAGLSAAWNCYYNPIISKDDFDWAKNIVFNSISMFIKDLEEGKIGNEENEVNQLNVIESKIKEFLTKAF